MGDGARGSGGERGRAGEPSVCAPGRGRRHWSDEEKARVVRASLGPGERVGEVARRYECCFSLCLVESPRQFAGLFRRRIAWDDEAIREAVGAYAVAFLMDRCCRSGEDVGARAPRVDKGWASAQHLSRPCPHAPYGIAPFQWTVLMAWASCSLLVAPLEVDGGPVTQSLVETVRVSTKSGAGRALTSRCVVRDSLRWIRPASGITRATRLTRS